MADILRDRLLLPDNLDERGRVWREHLTPVFDIEFGHATELSSTLDLTTYLCGDVIIGSVSAPVQRLERTRKKIVQQGLDHLLFQFYEKGSSVLRAESRENVVDANRFLIIDLSRPVVLEAAAVDAINLIVPRHTIADLLGSADHLHGRAFDLGDDPVSHSLRTYLRDLVAGLGGVPPERATMMSRAAVALCCACLPIHGPDIRSSTPMIKLAIRQHVEERLAEPSLAISTVVARFGLSRAKLERLFEPEGGFARYVTERRLQRALAGLTRGDGGVRPSVTAVAYAHGYADLGSFSRAFRRRFGVTPRLAGSVPLFDTRETDGGVLLSWMNQIVVA